jgi:hypothetical protein
LASVVPIVVVSASSEDWLLLHPAAVKEEAARKRAMELLTIVFINEDLPFYWFVL